MSTNENIAQVIEQLSNSNIDGCITGSAYMAEYSGVDVTNWTETPDVDVFCYSEQALVHALCFAMWQMGCSPGTGIPGSKRQEEWKIDRAFVGKFQKNSIVTTVKMQHPNGVTVNLTYKRGRENLLAVLSSFDMSIIMIGVDIRSKSVADLRGDHHNVATPNRFRSFDTSIWNVETWVRQFDRVIKYYNRGFDTRPMAEFYLQLIDASLAEGAVFTSEKYIDMYEEYTKGFMEQRKRIAAWLEEHKED